MKRIGWFCLGAVFFVSCGVAQINFPYQFFHASPIGVWEFPAGKLLGARPGTDKELLECKPTERDEQGRLIQKCVVVLYPELNKLIADYKQTKQALIDCQKGQMVQK